MTFFTYQGHYKYKPFGLCNAPSMFQVTMNELPKPFLRKLSWFSSMISLSTVHHYPRIFTIWKQFSLHFRRDTFTCTTLSVCFPRTDYIVLAILCQPTRFHQTNQNLGNGCLANSSILTRTTRLPQLNRILPKFYKRVHSCGYTSNDSIAERPICLPPGRPTVIQ